MFDFSNYSIIDLTLTYDESIRGFDSEDAKKLVQDGWNARTLHIYSHAGTHMDAPLHFGLKGTIDQFNPLQLLGNAWVIDIPDIRPKEIIGLHHLGNDIERIKKGDSLLIRTNWSKHLKNTDLYRNQLPRIGEEFAQWCVKTGIKILGVEPPSVADVNDLKEVTQIHHILLGGSVIIIEGLTNLDQLKNEQVGLIALPLKIKEGDGAPARVIALERIE